MRFYEFLDKPGVVVTNDEHRLLKRIREQDYMKKSNLEEYDQQIANQLVNKGVCKRIRINDKLCYKAI